MNGFELARRIGMEVYCRRNAAGLTQKALAARARISATTVADIESGRRNSQLGTIEVIAVALETDVGGLLKAALKIPDNTPLKEQT